MNQNAADSFVRTLDRALMSIAAIGLVAMMVHISADILMSLIFNAPIATTSAIVTSYYMIAVAFLPILAAEYRGNHIAVGLLTKLLPRRPRHALEIVVLAITAAVYLLLTVQSWQQAMHKVEINAYVVEQTSKILVWPAFFMLPVGFGLMTLLLVIKLILRITGGQEPRATEPPSNGPTQSEIEHV